MPGRNVIEDGCGGDLIAAGVVTPAEARAEPLREQRRVIATGLAAVINLIGRDKSSDADLCAAI